MIGIVQDANNQRINSTKHKYLLSLKGRTVYDRRLQFMSCDITSLLKEVNDKITVMF